MELIVDVSELLDLGYQITSASDIVNARIAEAIAAVTPRVEAIGVSAAREATPVGEERTHDAAEDGTVSHTPGKLRDSAVPVSKQDDNVLDVLIDQPAKAEPNLDGSGGEFPYILSVLKGRTWVFAYSAGQWSTGKQALRTPWGPRNSVLPVYTPTFDKEGTLLPTIGSATQALLDQWSIALMESIIAPEGIKPPAGSPVGATV